MSNTLAPRDHLRFHWHHARRDFWREWQPCFESATLPDRLLLILGTIRSLYWQALGLGVLTVAKTIGNWWRKTAPVHQLGEVVL